MNLKLDYNNSELSFDYIILNPPFANKLHLSFFEKGMELLNDNGKMCIIEPGRFYLNLIESNDYKTVFVPLLEKYKNNIFKVIIETLSFDFNITNEIPLSITYIDKSIDTQGIINAIICGQEKQKINIEDCNLIGTRTLVMSIINKIDNTFTDKLANHVDKKSNKNSAAYVKYQGKVLMNVAKHFYTGNRYGDYNNIGNFIIDDENQLTVFRPYVDCAFFKNREIYNSIQEDMQNFVVYDDYDTYDLNKKALENFKHFVYNSKVCHFICISYILGKNNTIRQIMPFITEYLSDDDIYKLCKFTEEEISLIEYTNKKYNRNSLWFKRYATGDMNIDNNKIKEELILLGYAGK